MGNIASLIGGLTISQTMDYIASKINEDIKESDIYQLALDGALKLSIRFGHSNQSAKKVIDVFDSHEGFPVRPDQEGLEDILCSYRDGEGHDTALLDKEDAYSLSDVCDLTLCGSERHEIEKLRNQQILGDKYEEPKGEPLPGIFVRNSRGELFCLVEMTRKQEKFKYVPLNRLPKGSFLVVRKDEIDRFINSSFGDSEHISIQQEESDPIIIIGGKNMNIGDFPKELQMAVYVYYEFWHDKPEGTNPATEGTVRSYIFKKLKDDLSAASLKRIMSITRPEKARKGGAPNSEWKEYKGKSQEK